VLPKTAAKRPARAS